MNEGNIEKAVNTARVCRLLGKTRAGYYKQRKARQRLAVEEDFIIEQVKSQRQIHPRMGCRKLMVVCADALQKAQLSIGRDRFIGLLSRRDMLVPKLKTFTPKTTRFDRALPVARNLVRDLEVTEKNQVVVADLTYVRTDEGFLYLSLIMDAFTRKAVGWNAGDTLETEGCLRALDMAEEELLKDVCRPIHHSDRGCQYGSHLYRQRLDELGIKCSMTEELHCYENAMAERLNGILKQEYGLGCVFATKKLALMAIAQAIYAYNELRPHEALGYKTPAEVHRAA